VFDDTQTSMQTSRHQSPILITVRSAGCNSSGAKNIVKGATGGAFLASNASKPFCQGSAPDPTVGAYDARIYPGIGRRYFPFHPTGDNIPSRMEREIPPPNSLLHLSHLFNYLFQNICCNHIYTAH